VTAVRSAGPGGAAELQQPGQVADVVIELGNEHAQLGGRGETGRQLGLAGGQHGVVDEGLPDRLDHLGQAATIGRRVARRWRVGRQFRRRQRGDHLVGPALEAVGHRPGRRIAEAGRQHLVEQQRTEPQPPARQLLAEEPGLGDR